MDFFFSPAFIVPACGALLVYIWFFKKDEDGDGNPEVPIPFTDQSLEIDRSVIQELSNTMAGNGFGQLAQFLNAMISRDAADMRAQARQMSSALQTPEGKYALLGKVVRNYIAEMSVVDREEFASVLAFAQDKRKDVEDGAKRALAAIARE